MSHSEITFDLDDRMTEESKIQVTRLLSIMKPAQAVHLDVNLNRQMRNENANKINGNLIFNNLDITEIVVKNSEDDYEILVSCYRPKDASSDAPITVFFHGGGWTLNSRITHHHSIASLATSSNTIWLSVEYRLCPEYKFPTPLNDCISVVHWVVDNKSQFSSATAKIGVSGDSSGGHFAALISHKFPDIIDYQILIYPCLYLGKDIKYDSHYEFQKDCYLLVPTIMEFFINNLTNDHDLLDKPILSPVKHKDFSQVPKTLMIVAELDPLRDHSKDYHEKIRNSDNESELFIIKGVHHGFFSQPVTMKNSFGEMQSYVVKFFQSL